MTVYSSLESVSDRCTVTLAMPPSPTAGPTVPALDSTQTYNLVVNGETMLSFTGIVKEREFGESKNEGRTVTVHLYQATALAALETDYETEVDVVLQNPNIPVCEDIDINEQTTSDTISDIDTFLTAAGGGSLKWNVGHQRYLEKVSYRGKIIDVLRTIASFFSISEMRKVVFYVDDDGDLIAEMLNLSGASGAGGAYSVPTKKLHRTSVSETKLPKIYKAYFTGGKVPLTIQERASTLTSETEDNLGNKTTITTTYTFDSIGRILKLVVVTKEYKRGGLLSRVETTETSTFTYESTRCGNKLTKIVSSTTVTEDKITDSEVGFPRQKESTETRYSYGTFGEMASQVRETKIYNLAGNESKEIKEVTEYHELTGGLLHKKYSYYSGSSGAALVANEFDALKLKYTTTEIVYGTIPDPETEGLSGATKAQDIYRDIVDIEDSVPEGAGVYRYSNPHILDPNAGAGFAPVTSGFQTYIDQLKELSDATRIDVTVSLSAVPVIKKGNMISVLDPRDGSTVNATVMEVTQSATVGSEFTTTVRAVRYEPAT
jgi:hypothetical protein